MARRLPSPSGSLSEFRAEARHHDRLRHARIGPDWLDTDRFDILANVPAGTSKEDAMYIMQNLLAERFELVGAHLKQAPSCRNGKSGSIPSQIGVHLDDRLLHILWQNGAPQ